MARVALALVGSLRVCMREARSLRVYALISSCAAGMCHPRLRSARLIAV